MGRRDRRRIDEGINESTGKFQEALSGEYDHGALRTAYGGLASAIGRRKDAFAEGPPPELREAAEEARQRALAEGDTETAAHFGTITAGFEVMDGMIEEAAEATAEAVDTSRIPVDAAKH